MKDINKIKLLARITGIIASAMVIYFIVSIGLAPENQGNEQIITINTMFAFLVFGFIIAWFREKEGGIILSFGSVITYMYFSYLPPDKQFPLSWMYAFMYVIPGLLFLYYSYLKYKQDN